MFYDLCLQVPVQDVEKAVEFAKELGWQGICLLGGKTEAKKLHDTMGKHSGIDVSIGLLLEPRSMNEMRRQVSDSRKNFEIIAVKSRSSEMSRMATETRGVDMLLGWESAGQSEIEAVMDYVMVKLAAEHDVSIAFSINPLLEAYDRSRAGVMSKLIEAAKFVRKYKSPFVLTSGALSPWDLRSPSELAAFGSVLGFNGNEIKKALSCPILAENRKRLAGKWVMPGVEVE